MQLTFSVISSEQEARRFPVGSHLIAFTSFWKQTGDEGQLKHYICERCVLLWEDAHEHKSTHCVSLECFNGSVLPQFTDVDAHVCTTGGERVVTLPVHVKCRSCGRMERGILDRNKKFFFVLLCVSSVYLSGKETVVWLLLYGHPI